MISFKTHKDRPDGREDVQFLSIFSHELQTVTQETGQIFDSSASDVDEVF